MKILQHRMICNQKSLGCESAIVLSELLVIYMSRGRSNGRLKDRFNS